MELDDYLRDEYRDLALVCDEVANEAEDQLTPG
jgi:hypothetical protein